MHAEAVGNLLGDGGGEVPQFGELRIRGGHPAVHAGTHEPRRCWPGIPRGSAPVNRPSTCASGNSTASPSALKCPGGVAFCTTSDWTSAGDASSPADRAAAHDIDEARARLDAHDVDAALSSATVPVLRRSEAPGSLATRAGLLAELRAAVLASADPVVIGRWTQSAAGRADSSAWRLLGDLLPIPVTGVGRWCGRPWRRVRPVEARPAASRRGCATVPARRSRWRWPHAK